MRQRILAVLICVALAGCFSRPDEGPADVPVIEPHPETCGSVPTYSKDPTWPPVLPNGWAFGSISGISVGPDDTVWILQRPGATADGGSVGNGPPVVQFDPEGNVLRSWGGPGTGYDWPVNEHGIGADAEGNIWITGNGGNFDPTENRPDNMLIKFTPDGEFLLQIGGRGVNEGSNDVTSVNQAADVAADDDELFVADGYGNRRVIVFGLDGAYRRHWGAYGNVPDDSVSDPNEQFGRPVHGISVASDGGVFVADRENARIQAFMRNGTFLREFVLSSLPGEDSPMAFDTQIIRPEEGFLVFGDGWQAGGSDRMVLMCRWNGDLVAEIPLAGVAAVGGPGIPLAPGQVTTLHAMGSDSHGNIYVADLHHSGNGGQVHKFVRTAS